MLTMIVNCILTFLILQKYSKAAELIERPNGYFITGAGCGGDNPIRYMNYIPEDLDRNQCTFINLDNSVPSIVQGLSYCLKSRKKLCNLRKVSFSTQICKTNGRFSRNSCRQWMASNLWTLLLEQ